MHAELFPQLLLNGLAIGLIYVLVASGLIILLGVVRIFNFAHAEFYMLGAFITFGMCEILHLNFFLSIAITIAIVIVLGSFSYQFIFRRLRGDILLCTGASIGLSMILMRGALLGFGTQERGLHPPYRPLFSSHEDQDRKGDASCETGHRSGGSSRDKHEQNISHRLCNRLRLSRPGRRYCRTGLLGYPGHGAGYLP